jgi:CRP/FNR family transcriptional regulator, nitrogen fixation regulation protein
VRDVLQRVVMQGRVVELFQQPFGGARSARRLTASVDTEAFDQLIDRVGVRISYGPKARIFHENDPAERIYKVVSGLVSTCKFLSDGRRQIGGFYLPGDYFGFECADTHTLSAEAVTNAQVRVVKKSVLAAVTNRDAIDRQLLLLTTRELARFQERALFLIKNAQERVGEFILEMEKRAKVGNSILLLMKRQDIADYLGLTIETVSRILTSLESCAAIKMPTSHQVVLRNPSTLRIAMEDRSKPALSNGHSSKTAARKRPDRRRHSVRTRVQQLVLPERNRAGPMQRGAKHDHGIKFTMEENS